MKKVFLFALGFMTVSLVSNAQDNGARPKPAQKSSTSNSQLVKEKAKAETEASVEMDNEGNKKGTPEYEEARKAERMRAEEEQNNRAVKKVN
jgi:hypothetical protein